MSRPESKSPASGVRIVTEAEVLSGILLLAVSFLFAVSSAFAQTDITIGGSSNLNFGILPRSGEFAVDYVSGAAAHFIVAGDSGKDVRLTISVSDLVTNAGASSNNADRTCSFTVANSGCAYSLDGGSSWYTFSTGTLYQDTKFPVGENGRGVIHVRIGGSLTSGARQQRGDYNGTVTLTAEYR